MQSIISRVSKNNQIFLNPCKLLKFITRDMLFPTKPTSLIDTRGLIGSASLENHHYNRRNSGSHKWPKTIFGRCIRGLLVPTPRCVLSHPRKKIINWRLRDDDWRTSVRDPDSKVHGAKMGPTWVLSAPDGPHVGPMNLAIKRPFAAASTIAVEQPTAKHQTFPIYGYFSYQDTSLPTCLFHVIVSIYVSMLLFHVMYHGIGRDFFCWYSRMYICFSVCVQAPNIHMAYLSHY